MHRIWCGDPRDIHIEFLLAAAQLRLLQPPRTSWQRAPITPSLWLTSWCWGNMGCWADRLEAKAAKRLGKERWKQYAANRTGQKGCLFVTPTVSKSHQGKCQAREIFVLLIHQTRGDREQKPTDQQQNHLCLFKAITAFSSPPQEN